MPEEAGLKFKISADADQAVSEIKKVQKAGSETVAATESMATAFAKGSIAADLITKSIGKITDIVVGAIPAMFELSKATADYAGEIVDAAQKTNAGTATLQALKFAAEQSGNSFEGITKSITKFSVLLGEAASGNDKAQATLKEYGITARDTDGALAQAIATIAKMTDGNKQNAAAAELFKDKSGLVISTIREMDGDLPAVIEKLRRTGELMGDEGLAAAEAYGDQLDALNKQLAGVGRMIGAEFIPVFSDMAQMVSDWAVNNKEEIRQWGQTTADVLGGVVVRVKEMQSAWQDFADFQGANKGNLLFLAGPSAILKYLEQLGKEARDKQPDVGEPYLPGGKRGSWDAMQTQADEEGKKAAAQRQKEREAAAKAEAKDQLQIYKNQLKTLETDFDKTLKNLEEAFKKSGDSEAYKRIFGNVSANFKAETDTVLADIDRVEKEIATKAGEGDNAATLRVQEAADRRTAIETKSAEATAEVTKSIREGTIADAKASFEWETKYFDAELAVRLAHAKEFAKAKGKSDADIAAFADSLAIDSLNKRKAELEKYQKVLVKGSEEYKRVQNEISILEQNIEARRATNAANQQGRDEDEVKRREKIIEKLKATFELYKKNAEKAAEEAAAAREQERDAALAAIGAQGVPFHPETGTAGQLAEDLIPEGEEFTARSIAIVAGLNAIDDASRAVGEAVGQMVHSWVLYGNIGTSVRQATAAILAGIAQQAAAKAAFHLAEGLAAIALGFFYPPAALAAPFHFASAAVYGAIAGITAIAGRVVAGNSFAKGATGAGTGAMTMQEGASRNATSGWYSGQKEGTTEGGANAVAPWNRPATIIIKDQTGMMGKLLEWEIDTNSRVRSLIVETASA